MDDADLDLAVRIAHRALFFNAGQSCNAGSRVFVHEKIYDEFIHKSVLEVKKIKLGSQFEKDTTQGPLVSKKQMERVLGYINSGVHEGAQLAIGGKRHGSKGFHVEPTIFVDVKDHMRIAKEEIFGPVMSIFKFSTIDEVISRANDSDYGLASAVFTKSLDQTIYLSNALRTGQVYVNSYGGQITAPFGGFKNSGIGRELGHLGVDMYLEDKTVIMAYCSYNIPHYPQ